MNPTVLILISFLGGYHDELGNEFEILYPEGTADPAACVREAAARVRAVITNGTTGIDAATIAALPKLELICSFSAGYEQVDVGAARQRGITVSHGPGVNAASAAELAIGLLVAAQRGVVHRDRLIRSGGWADARWLSPTIGGKRLGIVGLGVVGAAIATRAVAFDMAIGYHNRRPRGGVPYRFDTLQALAEWSDHVVVSCPGGVATRHLIDRTILNALGPNGYLVNIARGSVVETQALIAALEAGTIAGAALDVYEDEPAIPAALAAMDNVVLLPHVGGFTAEAFRAGFELVRENLRAHFAGQPLRTPVP